MQSDLALAQATVQSSTTDNPAANDMNATTAPANGTVAFVGSGATVTAGGNLDVEALENVTAALTSGGVTVGGVAVGASVSILNIHSNTQAYIDSDAVVSADGAIIVNAALTDNLSTTADAGSAAFIASVGTQVAIINDTSTEQASVNSNARLEQATSVTVSATADRILDSTSKDFANIGAAAAGAAVAQATAGGSTTATLGAGVQVGQATGQSVGSLTVKATDTSTVDATEFALSAGIGAAEGNESQATIDPDVQAEVDDSTASDPVQITVANGVNIAAQETPHADAEAYGVAVGLGAAIALVFSQASVSGSKKSYLGNYTDLSAGSLTIEASQAQDANSDPTAYASSTGGSGGLLVGATGGNSQVSTSGSVTASTGNSVTLPNGDVEILAMNQTSQSANATGGAAGALAVGAFTTTASSDVDTSAELGSSVITSSSRTGSLAVEASGLDVNVASTTAGSGGLVGVDAADATTEDQSTAAASLGGGTSTSPTTLYAGNVTVAAKNVSNYAPSVDSVNAAVVGGSGAVAANIDTNSATTTIGDYTTIDATGLVEIGAQNQYVEMTSGASATAGAGGRSTARPPRAPRCSQAAPV